MIKVKFESTPDGVFRTESEGRRQISRTPVTYPVRFSRPGVEVAESAPRVPRAGELYCLADQRPAKALFVVFEVPPHAGDVGTALAPAWILRVYTKESPPKTFSPEKVRALRDAVESGNIAQVFRLLDECPPDSPKQSGDQVSVTP